MLAWSIHTADGIVSPYVVRPHWIREDGSTVTSRVEIEAHSLEGARALIPAWAVPMTVDRVRHPTAIEGWWPGRPGEPAPTNRLVATCR